MKFVETSYKTNQCVPGMQESQQSSEIDSKITKCNCNKISEKKNKPSCLGKEEYKVRGRKKGSQ